MRAGGSSTGKSPKTTPGNDTTKTEKTLMAILSMAVTLFLIMDPFGNIPVFMPILEKVPANRRRRVLVRELLIALVVIVGAILCGRYVMEFLGLRQESVSMAGGIISTITNEYMHD